MTQYVDMKLIFDTCNGMRQYLYTHCKPLANEALLQTDRTSIQERLANSVGIELDTIAHNLDSIILNINEYNKSFNGLITKPPNR